MRKRGRALRRRYGRAGGALLTVVLRNGAVVLAKTYKGEHHAKRFANRTQAVKACEQMGAGWDVYRFGGLPFYVARVESVRGGGQ